MSKTISNVEFPLAMLILEELASERRFRNLDDAELSKLAAQLSREPTPNATAANDIRREMSRRRAARN